MSVTFAPNILNISAIKGEKLVLEPILESKQQIPFLETQILEPTLFKAGILQLNQILMAHPGVNLDVLYDPIVTVTETHVDFEGFARFGHSFCKMRFPEKLFAGPIRQEGKTNVDFNPRFIRDLRNRRNQTENLWLYIDPDGVEMAIDNRSYILKKMAMPRWWKDGYHSLNKYIDIKSQGNQSIEPVINSKYLDQYSKVVLSGKAFQKLVLETTAYESVRANGVRSLLWDGSSVKLVYNHSNHSESVSSVKSITPCNERINLWGIWRIQNLSEISEYIIQADAYLAKELPTFWLLHGRSGIQMLLGFTPYTNALWTETARKDVEFLLKHPYYPYINQLRRPRHKNKQRKKTNTRKNFVQIHPGQRLIPEYFLTN
jgi:hypothetical protein